MAIEPVRVAGHFIPNKDGYPAALSDNAQTAAKKAAETGLDNAADKGPVPQDEGRGENVNLTA